MKKANFLRKRSLNIKSQLFEWVKDGRVLMDLNNKDTYLLDDKEANSNDCKMLPGHIRKLITKYIREDILDNPSQFNDFDTLHCDGMLNSEALFSQSTIGPKWVNARKVMLTNSLGQSNSF